MVLEQRQLLQNFLKKLNVDFIELGTFQTLITFKLLRISLNRWYSKSISLKNQGVGEKSKLFQGFIAVWRKTDGEELNWRSKILALNFFVRVQYIFISTSKKIDKFSTITKTGPDRRIFKSMFINPLN